MNPQFQPKSAPVSTAPPSVQRIRYELRRRRLRVKDQQQLTPNMVRITLYGDDLKGFVSRSPDDHIKVFIPASDGQEAKRDYTPRLFNAQRNELTLDFAVHEAGPATQWALQAQTGDWLDIGGPRGSQVICGDIAHWLLIGDETALPAIGRRIEETSSQVTVTSLINVPHQDDHQVFDARCDHTEHWLVRDSQFSEDDIINQLQHLDIKPQTFCWVAGESSRVRRVRQYLLEQRGIRKEWIKASGYWKQGVAESSERFDD